MKKIFERVILLTIISILLVFANITSMAAFDDVKGHWCEEKINEFSKKGFISGDLNSNTFRPNDYITKVELAKIINKYFSFNIDEKIDWKKANIDTVKEKSYMSIIDGNANITREEFCVAVCRALKADTSNAKTNIYLDSGDISNWAVDSVNYLTNLRNINGYEDSTFKPKRNITRAEVIEVLYSIVGVGGIDIDTTEITKLQLGYITHNEYGIVVTPIDNKFEIEKGDTIYLAPILPENIDEENIKIEILSGKACVRYNQEDYEFEAIKVGTVKIKLSTKDNTELQIVNVIIK